MYLHHLTPVQRRELLIYCHHMALVDLEFAPEEKSFLAYLERNAHLDEPLTHSHTVEQPDLSVFTTKRSKTVAAMVIMMVAFVDFYLHKNESSFMGKLAGHMGFEQEDLNAVVEWAYAYDKVLRGPDKGEQERVRQQGESLIASITD